MKFLIVLSHFEEDEYTRKLIIDLQDQLKKDDHEIRIVDLHKIKFNPVGGKHDFQEFPDDKNFDYQGEQKKAIASKAKFSEDVQEQIDNIEWCDNIFYFFEWTGHSLDTMTKGYIDRCYAYNFAYGGMSSLGKKVMFVITSRQEKETKKITKYFQCINLSQNFSGNKLLSPFYIFDEKEENTAEFLKHVGGQFSFSSRVSQAFQFPKVKALSNFLF